MVLLSTEMVRIHRLCLVFTFFLYDTNKRMERAIAQSSVNAMFDMLEGKQEKVIIDPEKVDFGFEIEKPYKNVTEAIDYYMNDKICSHLPDEVILAMVSKEFNLTFEEAVGQVEKTIIHENGNVDLS